MCSRSGSTRIHVSAMAWLCILVALAKRILCWNLTATHTPIPGEERRGEPGRIPWASRRGGVQVSRVEERVVLKVHHLSLLFPRLLPKKMKPRMIRFFEKTLLLWNVVEDFWDISIMKCHWNHFHGFKWRLFYIPTGRWNFLVKMKQGRCVVR